MLYIVSIFINNVVNYVKKKILVIVDFVFNNIVLYFCYNVKSN